VMVEVPEMQKPKTNTDANLVERAIENEARGRESYRETTIIEDVKQSQRQPSPAFIRRNSRNFSRSPTPRRRGDLVEMALLNNTTSLNKMLSQPDACVETIQGQTLYLTTHPYHADDLNKWAWLFQCGVLDLWLQPEMPCPRGSAYYEIPQKSKNRRPYEYDDFDRYNSSGYRGGVVSVSLARLGTALKIFENENDSDTKKVKFVIVVQDKTEPGWVKLKVSHSRQAAAADILYEIVNGLSIAFVGAVLREVAVPSGDLGRKPMTLVRVESVTQAEDVGMGNVAVIC